MGGMGDDAMGDDFDESDDEGTDFVYYEWLVFHLAW